MAIIGQLAALALLAYGGVVLIMGALQRRFIYHPIEAPVDPAAAGLPWMRRVESEGRLLGWYCPPTTPGGGVVVFFHGNRGTVARIAHKAQPWRDHGLGIFAATYRGYEGNPGKPSEQGLYDDARTVLDWLARVEGIDRSQVILYGESLGTGVAAQMALEHPPHALILEAPYSSIARLAAERYPWLPCLWLIRDRFDTLSKIDQIDAPLLILHGDADRTIPLDHALRLTRKAPTACLEIIPGGAHIDLYERGATEKLWFFINNVGLPRSLP